MRQAENMPEEYRLYHQYYNDVKKYPLLTREKEMFLVKECKKGSESAKNKLILSNLKFVIKIAFMYRGQGLPVPDLINEGNLGLIRAADRFNPDKKIKFTSYAVWWIRQAIVQAIFEKARLVRLSAANEQKIRQLKRFSKQSSQLSEKDAESDIRLLAEKSGQSKSLTHQLLIMNQKSVSLHTPLGGKGKLTFADTIRTDDTQLPDWLADYNSVKGFLHEKLDTLNPKEKKVITMFFGLDSGKALSLTEIGDVIGLSKERVRQIKETALEKLRDLNFSRQQLLVA